MPANRRQFTRIHFRTPARLLLPDSEIAVEVADLSLKGALVRPIQTAFIKVGTHGALEIPLDGGEATIGMDITVVHRESDYIGLACREIDIDSITHLRRLVELNIGDETVLQRELNVLGKPA